MSLDLLTRAEVVSQTIPYWTEGICGDGAVILRDGIPVTIQDVLAILNGNGMRLWKGFAMSSGKNETIHISPLEIEATILGLKAVTENAWRKADIEACARACRLIRALADQLNTDPHPRNLMELAHGIQIAHAAWMAMGAPGAWETEDAQQQR